MAHIVEWKRNKDSIWMDVKWKLEWFSVQYSGTGSDIGVGVSSYLPNPDPISKPKYLIFPFLDLTSKIHAHVLEFRQNG